MSPFMPASSPEGTIFNSLPNVQVVDSYGNGVPGVPVSFTATEGSVVTGGNTTTDVSGFARPQQWTLGPDEQTLTATANPVPAPNVVNFKVTGMGAWTFIASGQQHTCALNSTARAYCWGRNSRGQLGDGTTTNSPVPVAVLGGRIFAKLSVGWEHVCGIEQGTQHLFCWGRNDMGGLGDGTNIDRSQPTQMSMPAGVGDEVVDIAAGGGHTCALTPSGTPYCWGFGQYGVLGDGTTNGSLVPVPVFGNPTFTSIAAGISHTCALSVTGETFCWGFGFLGEIGTTSDPTLYYRDRPGTVVTSRRFARLALGGNYTCAIRAIGDVMCWGENRFGQAGTSATATCDGIAACTPLPTEAAPWESFTSLALGRSREWQVNGYGSSVHTCGVNAAGRGFCWGSNDAGQLASGAASAPRATPQPVVVPVSASQRIQGFAAGYRHTCVLSETNHIWCVGANESGQLGTGSSASQVVSLARVSHP